MKKAVIGTVLGALVYFVWGAVSWTVLPWHTATMKALPNETLLLDTLKTVVKEPGLYCFPHDTGDHAAWAEKMRTGPGGLMVYSPVAGEPMAPATYASGFAGTLILSALLMWVLWASRLKKVVHRIHLAAAVGLIAGLAVTFPEWNYMRYPTGHAVVTFLDLLIGFIIAGAVMCPFVPDTSGE